MATTAPLMVGGGCYKLVKAGNEKFGGKRKVLAGNKRFAVGSIYSFGGNHKDLAEQSYRTFDTVINIEKLVQTDN